MTVFTLLPLCIWLYSGLCVASPATEGFMSRYTVKHHNEASRYLFFFGDSYTRILYDSDGEAPSKANIIGNPAWPGPTTSGGLIWAEILGSQYNNSLTFIYDYAFGGATIDNNIVAPPGGKPLEDINIQVQKFQDHMAADGAPRWAESNKALFAVWFGQNDVYQLFRRSVSDPETAMDLEYAVYFRRMEGLYQLGARNFLWIGVSPIARSPMVLADSSLDRLASLCETFNNKLATSAQAFADSHPGITWRYYDPAPAFDRVLDNPQGYGAPDNHCTNGDGTTCLWWNDFHPGVAIHTQVAADIAANVTVRNFFVPTI